MQKGQPDARPRKLESMRDQGQVPDSHYGEQMQGMEHQQQGGSGHADISRYRLPNPDPLAAEALDETAALLLQTGRMPRYLDWSEGVVEGGLHDNSNWHGADGSGQVVGQGLGNPDSLAAEARDETAALLLEMGGMPRYLEWGEGFAEGGVRGEGSWREGGRKGGGSGGGGGGGEEMRGVGKRADGEWDWQALRKGVVVDERGDVAFYDGSFVEDPWRGLRG